MRQIDTNVNTGPVIPHDAATRKYKSLQVYIVSGLLILVALDVAANIALHLDPIIFYCLLSMLVFLAYYLLPWTDRKQEQARLLSGIVDREWYETNITKLNETASRLAANLELPDIQIEIGLKDLDFEVMDFYYTINKKIYISAKVVNEFSSDEIEFLLACCMFNYRRYRFNDHSICPYIYVISIMVAFPFSLLFQKNLQPAYCFGFALVFFHLTTSSLNGIAWKTSTPKYKKILDYTRNYDAAKSAVQRMSRLDTSGLAGQEMNLDIIQHADLQLVHKAARELGLVN